jgi:hypothetical protein
MQHYLDRICIGVRLSTKRPLELPECRPLTPASIEEVIDDLQGLPRRIVPQ